MTTLALDPFTRTVGAGSLGNEPVTNTAYALVGTAADFSVTGTVGRISTVTVASLYYGTVSVGTPDMMVRVSEVLPVVPLTSPITLRAVARFTDSSNYYEATLSVATSGTVTLNLSKRVATVGSSISSSPSVGTHSAGNKWTIVLEVFGSTIRARAWNATSGSDGGVWTVTATDTALTTGNRAGFGTRRESGNTNGTQSIDVDDFSVETLITVTAQDVWPPRVLISVTNILIGESVAIYRGVGTTRTLVQNGSTVATTDVAFLRIDAELPFGTPVYYVAVINNDETRSASAVYTLTGGKVAITDAITALAAEVVIWAWPDRAYDRQSTVYKPAGRNVVVSGDLGQFEADLELYTDTTSAADNLRNVIANATQAIVQIRQPGGYDSIDCHVVVTSYRPRRYSQDGSDQKRIHALHVVEVDGWASALGNLGFTYQNLIDTYVGLTYAQLTADYATYLLLNQGDFS